MIPLTPQAAEETGVLEVAGDGEAADVVVIAVVVSREGMAVVNADWRPFTVERNGGRLLEVHVVVLLAAVYVGSQLRQVTGIRDLVRGFLRAVAAGELCPRRLCGGAQHHHEQHNSCPDGK